jgi:hypothetical protein
MARKTRAAPNVLGCPSDLDLQTASPEADLQTASPEVRNQPLPLTSLCRT